jgi:hypothetical protein
VPESSFPASAASTSCTPACACQQQQQRHASKQQQHSFRCSQASTSTGDSTGHLLC